MLNKHVEDLELQRQIGVSSPNIPSENRKKLEENGHLQPYELKWFVYVTIYGVLLPFNLIMIWVCETRFSTEGSPRKLNFV